MKKQTELTERPVSNESAMSKELLRLRKEHKRLKEKLTFTDALLVKWQQEAESLDQQRLKHEEEIERLEVIIKKVDALVKRQAEVIEAAKEVEYASIQDAVFASHTFARLLFHRVPSDLVSRLRKALAKLDGGK